MEYQKLTVYKLSGAGIGGEWETHVAAQCAADALNMIPSLYTVCRLEVCVYEVLICSHFKNHTK